MNQEPVSSDYIKHENALTKAIRTLMKRSEIRSAWVRRGNASEMIPDPDRDRSN